MRPRWTTRRPIRMPPATPIAPVIADAATPGKDEREEEFPFELALGWPLPCAVVGRWRLALALRRFWLRLRVLGLRLPLLVRRALALDFELVALGLDLELVPFGLDLALVPFGLGLALVVFVLDADDVALAFDADEPLRFALDALRRSAETDISTSSISSTGLRKVPHPEQVFLGALPALRVRPTP